MKFISLFSGIGGLDLGLERAGMECVAQVDIDDFCRRVRLKHWPHVPQFGDIRDVGKHNLPPADLICGGAPCQPFSVAGKQKGTEDDRHLWPEMLRVITELKPAFVVFENVPGIVNLFLDQAIADLEDQGHTCETFVLPACAFDAPHRRDRVFVVAYASKRDDGSGHDKQVERQKQKSGKCGSEADVSNANQPRLEIGERGNGTRRTQTATDGRYRRPIEPGLGGMVDELSPWMDEPDIPRIATGVPDRVNRLKALGNAVVPAVAEHIGRMIMKYNSLEE